MDVKDFMKSYYMPPAFTEASSCLTQLPFYPQQSQSVELKKLLKGDLAFSALGYIGLS